jgi:DNA mismatch repair protein MutL
MGLRIQQLSSAMANQIAAGEVIERPASVVKELLENSLDAGADVINIDIGYGGLNHIKISDNGSGIVAEDLPLAVAAHATSKISTLNDLYAIESMGFRGEALASIASIAKITLSSRPAQQEHAMMLQMQGAEFSIVPCARNVGTTIEVVDLFFNAPVRKRFLKNEKIEFQAIEMVVKRFALSAPHIAITLRHNAKPVLSLPAALSEQNKQMRITKIFGSAFIKEAIFLDVEQGALRLQGWVSGRSFQRSQNDRQWIYINQRMVKDKLLQHALKQTYEGLLHPGRFPACLLYFTINSAEVDVNVHPTKHEVRFQQPRLVHDFFTSQLTRALKSEVLIPGEQLVSELVSQNSEVCEPQPYLFQTNDGHSQPRSFKRMDLYNDSSIRNIESNCSTFGADESSSVILNNQYSIVFIAQKPYIVDMRRLQHQWVYHQLSGQPLPLANRPLLVPVNYAIPPALESKKEDLAFYLGQLGLNSEYSKEGYIFIRSIPMSIPYLDIRLFLETVATLELFSLEGLKELLAQCQVFDLKFLSNDEQKELVRFFLQLQHQETTCSLIGKQLTIDDCRMLLDV